MSSFLINEAQRAWDNTTPQAKPSKKAEKKGSSEMHIATETRDVSIPFSLNDYVTVSSEETLAAKSVIFIDTPTKKDVDKNPECLNETFENIQRAFNNTNNTTLAVPLFDIGNGKISAKTLAETAIPILAQSNGTVIVVGNNEDQKKAFDEAAKGLSAKNREKVQYISGDLLAQKADAIVCPVSDNFNERTFGDVAKKVVATSNKAYEQAVKSGKALEKAFQKSEAARKARSTGKAVKPQSRHMEMQEYRSEGETKKSASEEM